MADINPSEFLRAFRFERFTKTANNSAGSAEAYELLFNTRGKWEQTSGSRGFDNGQDLMITTYKVTCYWRSIMETMIDKDTRLIYENRIYRIDNIERVGEKRQYYQFTVSEAH